MSTRQMIIGGVMIYLNRETLRPKKDHDPQLRKL